MVEGTFNSMEKLLEVILVKLELKPRVTKISESINIPEGKPVLQRLAMLASFSIVMVFKISSCFII